MCGGRVMKTKNIKKTLFIYLPYECTAVEEYLEKKAEEGWLLESIKLYIFKFKKIEPKKIKYSVDILQDVSVFDYKENNEALEYKEYCETARWNYVCQTGNIQVYYTEDCNGSIPIHTNMREKFKSVLKSSLLPVGFIFLWLLQLLYQQYNLFVNGNGIDSLLSSNLGLVLIIINIILTFAVSTQIISFIHWVIKARIELKQNRFMPYNNYKKLKVKNNLMKVYFAVVIFIIILLPITAKEGDRGFYAVLVVIMFIPIILLWAAIKFIKYKKYSKKINISIIVGSILLSLLLSIILVFESILWSSNPMEESKVLSEAPGLTLKDFGYEEQWNKFSLHESIIAKDTSNLSQNETESLLYFMFECKYPWAINLHLNNLLNGLDKVGFGLEIVETKLPSNIKVYATNNKRKYILASQGRILDTYKVSDDISEDEFLDIVYKKVFLND